MEDIHPLALTRLKAMQRITQLLLKDKIITQQQLDQIDKNQGEESESLETIFSHGYLTPSDFLDFLLGHPDLTSKDLQHFEISHDLIAMIPKSVANKYQVVPIDYASEILTVASTTPLDEAALHALGQSTDCEVRAVWCHTKDVLAVIDRYYTDQTTQAEPVHEELSTQITIQDSLTTTVGLENPIRLTHTAHLVRQIKTLPALPETVTQVREATQRPDSSIEDVVHIITLDPPIAAKVLGVVNSPAYGFKHKVYELKLAVSLMGLKETCAVVLSASIVDMVNKLKHFDYRTFFLEAVCCATAARIVAKTAGKQKLVGIFTAGLLHNIGKAALWEVAPELCAQIDDELTGEEMIQAEEQIIGLSHVEAGYELARYWELPPEIAEPIRLHHNFPQATVLQEHVATIAIANHMVSISGSTLEQHPEFCTHNQLPLQLLGIDEELAEAMLKKYLDRHQNAVREAFG